MLRARSAVGGAGPWKRCHSSWPQRKDQVVSGAMASTSARNQRSGAPLRGQAISTEATAPPPRSEARPLATTTTTTSSSSSEGKEEEETNETAAVGGSVSSSLELTRGSVRWGKFARRPGMDEIPASAKRLTVNCWTSGQGPRGSAATRTLYLLALCGSLTSCTSSRPQDHWTVPAPKTRAPPLRCSASECVAVPESKVAPQS
mmetsp:Transcript_4383/g.13712  ORF Transcript_4383/g.13712 Transcript_4383/m.13712 type:complete len:203 (+) Transcript_4383:181-789(+)